MSNPLNLEDVCKKQAARIRELEQIREAQATAQHMAAQRIAELEANISRLLQEVTQLCRQNDLLVKLLSDQRTAVANWPESFEVTQEKADLWDYYQKLVMANGFGSITEAVGKAKRPLAPQSREDAGEGQEKPVVHYRVARLNLCGELGYGCTNAIKREEVTCPACLAKMRPEPVVHFRDEVFAPICGAKGSVAVTNGAGVVTCPECWAKMGGKA